MTRAARTLVGVTLVTAAAWGAPTLAQPVECPSSCIDFSVPPCTTLSKRSDILGPSDDIGLCKGSYDLTLGRAHAEGRGNGAAGAMATVTAVDDFVLSGPGDLSPVSIVVSFRLIGDYTTDPYGVGGSGGATLESGGTTLDVTYVGTGPYGTNVDTTLRIPLTVSLGEPFRVTYEVRGSTGPDGHGTSEGRLSFESVPDVVAVRSCQGYGQDGAVPARAASWGAVKIRYR